MWVLCERLDGLPDCVCSVTALCSQYVPWSETCCSLDCCVSHAHISKSARVGFVNIVSLLFNHVIMFGWQSWNADTQHAPLSCLLWVNDYSAEYKYGTYSNCKINMLCWNRSCFMRGARDKAEGKSLRGAVSVCMCVCEDWIISARLTQDLPPAVVYAQPSAWKLMVIMWSSLHHLVCLFLCLASFCSPFSCVFSPHPSLNFSPFTALSF